LYYRDRCCISGGWCKASWIADVFRVDLRNVKAARKHLVSIGWIEILDTPRALCNRWGHYTRIHLSWTRATIEQAAQDDVRTPAALPPPTPPRTPPAQGAARQDDVRPPGSVSPPPPAFSTTESPPPIKEYREPL